MAQVVQHLLSKQQEALISILILRERERITEYDLLGKYNA
jgi:hypothetical protein